MSLFFPQNALFFSLMTPLSPGTSSPGSRPPVDPRGRSGGSRGAARGSRWAATPASHGAASPQPPSPPLTATEPEEEATKTRITIFTSSAGTRGRGDGTGQDTGSAASSLPPQAPPEASRRRERREAGRWGRRAGAAGRCSPAARRCVVLGKCGVRKPAPQAGLMNIPDAPSAKCRHPCVKVCQTACTVPLVCCLLAPQHHRCRVRGAQDA